MTSPDGARPTKAVTYAQISAMQNYDPAIAAGVGNSDVTGLANLARGNLLTNILGGFIGGIGQFISQLFSGIFGGGSGGGGSFLDLVGAFLGVKNKVNSHDGQIIDLGNQVGNANERLDELESFAGTGVTTALYDSIGGRDFVTFPDSMMMPIPSATVTGSTNLGTHRHDGVTNARYTDYENLGSHTHTISSATKPPAFNQTASTNIAGGTPTGTIDLGLLRGGFDGEIPIEMLRLITGGDASPFGIDAWYLGIYVYDQSNSRFAKIWDPGNVKDTLVNQRQRYNLATGLTSKAQNDQILAVATLQIAPGALQFTRGIGCIFQTNISEPAGTFPQARAARIPEQTSLPQYIPVSSLVWDKERLMWAGLGPLPT